MDIFVCAYDSKVGELGLASTANGVLRIHLGGKEKLLNDLKKAFPDANIVENRQKNQQLIRQLDEYFAGSRRSFDLPLDLQGTSFRKRVWHVLQEVPFGKTTTYGQLAKKIGKPGAARAVGQANHFNPIPIIIPCHRVIGANGKLTGFGGGLEMKARLLQHEGAL